MKIAPALDVAIKAVCPIQGVSIGRETDKATWRVDYVKEATAEQRAAAENVVKNFDIDACLARSESNLANLLVAKGILSEAEIAAVQ